MTDLVGKIAPFPLVLGSTAQPLRVMPFPIVSRIFHDFNRVCHLIFSISLESKKRPLPCAGVERSPEEIEDGELALPAVSHATLMPG